MCECECMLCFILFIPSSLALLSNRSTPRLVFWLFFYLFLYFLRGSAHILSDFGLCWTVLTKSRARQGKATSLIEHILYTQGFNVLYIIKCYLNIPKTESNELKEQLWYTKIWQWNRIRQTKAFSDKVRDSLILLYNENIHFSSAGSFFHLCAAKHLTAASPRWPGLQYLTESTDLRVRLGLYPISWKNLVSLFPFELIMS